MTDVLNSILHEKGLRQRDSSAEFVITQSEPCIMAKTSFINIVITHTFCNV